MSDKPINPYAPPQAVRDHEVAGGSSGTSSDLQPCSVLLMIVLTIITAGLYFNYWVHRLTKTINRNLQHQPLSMGLVGLFWFVSVASLLWLIPELLMEEERMVSAVSKLLSRADMVLGIMMSFIIRGGLNRLLMAPRTHPAWFHGLWTFLFGPFYLQWKINRNLRAGVLRARSAKPASQLDLSFAAEDHAN